MSRCLSAVARRWPLALLVFIAGSGIAWALARPPEPVSRHTAELRMAVQGERRIVTAAELVALVGASKAGPLGPPETWALSAPVRTLVARHLAGPKKDPDLERAIEAKLAASLRVERAGEALILRVTTADADESLKSVQAAGEALAKVAAAESEAALEQASKTAHARRLQLQQGVLFKELDYGDQEGTQRSNERQVTALVAAAADIERHIQEVRARQTKTELRLQALGAAEHRLRESLPSGPEEDGLSSPVLKRLKQDMDSIDITVAQDRLARTPDAPRFRELSRRRAELDEEYRTELHRVRSRTIVTLRDAIAEMDLELKLLDEQRLRRGMEIDARTQDIRQADPRRAELESERRELAGAEDLSRRLEQARASAEGISFAPGEAVPLRPAAPAAPAGAYLALGLVGAALSALLAAWVIDALDTRVRTDADVRSGLGLPSLGVLPPVSGETSILRLSPANPLSESFAMSATLLRSYLSDHDYRSFLVTSAEAGEGKSMVAANLAVALARKGLHVALVEGDLRRPRLHEIMGVDNSRGLTTLLRGEETDPEAVLAATEVPALRVLPSGPISEVSSDLVESPMMGELCKTLREKFDIVIFDGPPVGSVADSLTLARLADTCVWVIRSGRCDRRTLGWVRHLLRNVGADVAGVILNGARRRGGERYYAPVATASSRA